MADQEVPPDEAAAETGQPSAEPQERAEEPAESLPEGMAVLVSVPFEVAKRLEAFLVAHRIVCEVRKQERGSAGPSQKGSTSAPSSATEPYDSGMRHAARNLLKVRSTPPTLPDLVSEKDPRTLYDVLVRQEDLAPAAGADAGPGEEPEMLEMVEGVAGELVVLCRLPWQEAWALAGRLTDDGIPAVAVPDAAEDREMTLERRIIPVAVRPEDLETARAAIAS